MKRQIVSAILFGLFIATTGFGVQTDVIYRAAEVGDGRWQYTYDVNDISLPVPVEQSTISLDFGLHDNLAVETTGPSHSEWEQMVWHLGSVLKDDGPYDPNASAGGTQKAPANRGGGFAVSSDRLAQGKLAAQFRETIGPPAFEATDEGWIIPEPATLLLLGLGALALRNKHKSSRIWNVEIGSQH